MFKTRYWIVRDNYAGFETQAWWWWLPIWFQIGCCNTHITVERAESFIKNNRHDFVKFVTK